MKIATLLIGSISLFAVTDARAARPSAEVEQRAMTGGEPNNGTVTGKVSCYSPPAVDKPGCAKSMQGCNEVAKKNLCPGFKPYHQAYQTPKDGMYVVAASGKFRKQVGMGAKIRLPGVPGIGIVCDVCPGCDKYGKLLDIASNNPAHNSRCPLTGTVQAAGGKIEIVSSGTKRGGK